MKAKGKGKGHPTTCQWRHSGGVEVIILRFYNNQSSGSWVVPCRWTDRTKL